MRRRTYTFFSLVFFFLYSVITLYAQNNSLLWEIKGDSLKGTCYLFGTMHVKDKRAFQFHDSLFTKLYSCQTFAGELVLDKEAAKEIAPTILLPQGSELKTLLSPSEYKRVKKYCKKHMGAMSLLVNRILPVFTYALLSESTLESDMSKALDEYLQDKAKDKKMAVKGLETMQEQMNALNQLSYKEQAQMLLEFVDHPEEVKTEMQRLADVYATQNLDSIYSFTQTPEMQGEFGDAMIKDRNIRMADRLTVMMKNETVFCAIGAAHLPGNNGVLQLLRNKGFTIRPILKKPY